jgi:hypothetical protein
MQNLTIIFYSLLTLVAGFITYKGLDVYYTTKKKIAGIIALSFMCIILHHITQICNIADATFFLFFALLIILFAFYRKLNYLANPHMKFFQLRIPTVIMITCTSIGILFFIAMLLNYIMGTALYHIRIISHIIIRIGILILGYVVFKMSKSNTYTYVVQSFIIICFATLLIFPISLLIALFATTSRIPFLFTFIEIPAMLIALYAYYLSLKAIYNIQEQQEIY